MAQIESLRTEQKFKKTEAGEIPVEWEVTTLGNICEVVGGSTPSTEKKEFWDGEILWAVPTDITKLKGNEISSTKKKITKEGLGNCAARILPAGSILLTSRATIGACAINTKPMATNQGFASLICGENVYNWYIFYKIVSLKDILVRFASGSTFKEIPKSAVRSLKIALPSSIEQKKIAGILLSVDSAIEKITQLIEKKKELKKGLMQELLQFGIRNSEFGVRKLKKTAIGEIPEGWEVVQLKKIGKIITGSTPSTKIKEYFNGEYMFVTPFDMGDFKYVKKTARRLSEEGMSVSRRLPKDTVMVTCIASIGKIGMASEGCSTNQQINSIICNNNVDSHFIYYMMLRKVNFLKTLACQTAVPIIKKSLFENVFIPLPSFHEQKRIAEIISSFDNDIEDETNEKSKLAQLKKGLMQALLAGKVRVKM